MRFLLLSLILSIFFSLIGGLREDTYYFPMIVGGCNRCQISEPHPWPHATITPEASTAGEDNNGI